MCLTIPRQIIEVRKDKAVIQENDKKKEINISTIPMPKVGDWILIHANLAIKKISKKEADEINKTVRPRIAHYL